MLIIEIVFWFSIALCLYVYFGYPLALFLTAAVRRRTVLKREHTPGVSVVIAAHNEEKVIGDKLRNLLESDYPPDRLEILVGSDGSTDATEAVVAGFGRQGVRLLSLARCGKVRALNQTVAEARGEIVVFTDANAMFERDAVKRLVANFADPEVGGVCGNQKHRQARRGDSAREGEKLYWSYDKFIKHLETQVGSIVGADGSIYAVRKDLFVALDDGAQADDFAISARVVTQGRRLVYEPEAVSYEDPPAASESEFWRKVRVTNHSMRGILNLPGGLNPLRTGLYAVELWSHKVLRYLVPLLMIAALATNALLAARSGFYGLMMAGQLLFYGAALAGWALKGTRRGRAKVFYGPFYFCLANIAALLGMLSLLRGERITAWRPDRETTEAGGQEMKMKCTRIALVTCLALLAQLAAATADAQESDKTGSNQNQSSQNSTTDQSGGQTRRRSGRGRDDDSAQRNSNSRQGSEQENQLDEVAQQEREGRPAAIPPPTRRASDSRYRIEFGVLPHYNSNYFQVAEGTPKTSVWITTLSANFGYDFVRREDKTFSGELRLRRNVFSELRNADSTDIDAELAYDFGPNRLELTYFATPRRLSSFDEDPIDPSVAIVTNSVNGASLQYARRLTRRLRARTTYEFAREIYNVFKERDLGRHRVGGDVRYRVRQYFTPGIGFEYGRVNARSDAFSRDSTALVLLVGSRFGDRVNTSFRYRFQDRDYLTRNTAFSNFGREDRRHDFTFYGTVNLGRGFSLYGFTYAINNNSSRPTRNFNTYDTGLGLFFRFPR